jgi:endoglycosylceramidase
VADRVNLQPFYDRLHDAVRAVDNDTVLFFEPASGGNILDTFHVGFQHGPGGAGYDRAGKNVLSYHIYCPLLESDLPFDSNSTNWLLTVLLDVLRLGACDALNGFQYAQRAQDVQRLGVGGWLSEFGAVPNDVFGQAVIQKAMTTMDTLLHSWTYWYIDAVQDDALRYIVNDLTRPFAHRTWGTPLSMSFDNTTKVFVYMYRTPATTKSEQRSTTVFLSPTQYMHGVDYAVAPTAGITVSLDAATGMLTIEHDAALLSTTVSVFAASMPVADEN